MQVMLRIAKHQSVHVEPPAPGPGGQEDWGPTKALALWRKLQRKPSPQSLDAAGGGGGSGRGGSKGMDHSTLNKLGGALCRLRATSAKVQDGCSQETR